MFFVTAKICIERDNEPVFYLVITSFVSKVVHFKPSVKYQIGSVNEDIMWGWWNCGRLVEGGNPECEGKLRVTTE